MTKYTVGDKVIITNRQSMKHFEIANMSIRGIITKIDDDNFHRTHQSRHHRPIFVQFPDRPGSYAYGKDEIKRIK